MVSTYPQYNRNTISAPHQDGMIIIPSDTLDLFTPARSLYVGVGGDVTLQTDNATQLTYKGVPSGKILPVVTKRVLNTGTTAANILALGQGSPGWLLNVGGNFPVLDLDFINARAFVGGAVTTLENLLTCTRASSGYYQNADGTLKNFPGNNTLRYGSNGLLVEESRTNFCLQSQSLANATWATQSAITTTDNATLAPDGTLTADSLIETAVTGDHIVQQPFTLLNATQYTFSCYAKPSTRNWLRLEVYDGTTQHYAFINLVGAGVVGTLAAGSTATVAKLANGWYFCTTTFTTGNTIGQLRIGPSAADNQPFGYAGDGVSGLFAWGAQLEQNGFASSYIPTTSASATRAEDIIKSNSISWFNINSGTLYSQQLSRPATNDYGYMMEFYQAAGGQEDNTRILTFQNTGTSDIHFDVTFQDLIAASAIGANTLFKMASAYALNDMASSINGASAVTLGVGSIQVGIDTFGIGAHTGTGGRNMNNYFKRVSYFSSRLSNANLQTLST